MWHRLWIVSWLTALGLGNSLPANELWNVYEGSTGAGVGKHIVLISGDEEYRSEEMMPALGKILAKHHGFRCTVLYAIDPKDGTINPNNRNNIPGLEALQSADLCLMFLRFRDLPDEQMKHIIDYVNSGKPLVGIRTSTHAFDIKPGKTYSQHSWKNKDGGFGKVVFGETWVSHHGQHGKQSQRGVIAPGQENNPIVRGIGPGEIWGPSDVYGVRELPDCTPVVLGQVLVGMKPDDKPVEGKQNNPMMPIAWTKTYTGTSGRAARVFCSTMGCSQDFESVGYRRLMVNACYWALGLEDKIPEKSNVDLVGEYKPTPFKFGGFVPGRKPADLAMPK